MAFADVSDLLAEYEAALTGDNGLSPVDADYGAAEIQTLLVTGAEWSPLAANHLVDLVRENGAFILRNALALSLALGVEDGELAM